MSTPARREARIPDLFDLFDMFDMPALRPGQAIRVEDYVDDGNYVVRAELPGIEPDKNLEINVSHGILAIHAERKEEHAEHQRSEFRYGSYDRQIRLPDNVKEEEIKAGYDKGILTVTVPLHKEKETTRRIPIER